MFLSPANDVRQRKWFLRSNGYDKRVSKTNLIDTFRTDLGCAQDLAQGSRASVDAMDETIHGDAADGSFTAVRNPAGRITPVDPAFRQAINSTR